MPVVGRLDQYASMLAYEFDETTANGPSITGLGTYYASEFSENVGIATTMTANVFPPYDLVYDEFGGTLFGAGQGRYMRQNTDKSVIVYNEIDEITDLFGRGIVRDGLVLDLDAGNTASYSGSGTTWTDLSASGNNGTLTNGPTYSSANGGSIVFDGVDDYGYIDYSASLAPTSAISGGGWIYYSNWTTSSGNIFSKLQSGGYALQHSSIGVNVYFLVRLGGVYQNSAFNKSLMNSGWNHIYGTFDGRYIRMYLNGNAVGTPYDYGSVAPIEYAVNNNLGICVDAAGGSSNSVEGTTTNAKISNIQIYNRALTAAEISQNYNALKGRFGL